MISSHTETSETYTIMLKIHFIEQAKFWFNQLNKKRSIKLFDLVIFFRQFAALLSAGIPLIQCHDILEKSQTKSTLRLLIHSIKKELLAGNNLSNSLRFYSHYFDELVCELIKIGEHTGQLDIMLTIIAHHYEKKLNLKNQIKQALFYPFLILSLSFLLTLSMFIFIIPRFATFFQNSLDNLPLFTIGLFYLSSKLNQYIWLIIFLCCMFSFMVFIFKNNPSNLKFSLLQLATKLPLINQCMQKVTLSRFARNLAITLRAGIPIIEALTLASNATGRSEFIKLITKIRYQIRAGIELHQAIENLAYFPDLMMQMVQIGEKSGTLEDMLDKVADFLESDINQLVTRLSQLFEPLIMVILGVLIGGLLIGMYLPIFKLGSAI